MGRWGSSRWGTTRWGESSGQTVNAPRAELTIDELRPFITVGKWAVDGVRIDVTDVTVQYDRTEVEFRTQVHDQLSHLRTLNDHAGEFERIVDADGGWTTIDRSTGDNNTVSLTPPEKLQPTLVAGEYHVDRYTERPVRDDGRVVRVRVSFVPTTPRDVDGTDDNAGYENQEYTRTGYGADITQSSEDWEFTFSDGTIVPEYVERTDQANQADIEFQMSLSDAEVEALLESATRLDAVRVIDVPDGDDFIRDANPDNRNTVTISQPSSINSEYLPTDGGDYAVQSWRVSRENPRWRVRMTVRELP